MILADSGGMPGLTWPRTQHFALPTEIKLGLCLAKQRDTFHVLRVSISPVS